MAMFKRLEPQYQSHWDTIDIFSISHHCVLVTFSRALTSFQEVQQHLLTRPWSPSVWWGEGWYWGEILARAPQVEPEPTWAPWPPGYCGHHKSSTGITRALMLSAVGCLQKRLSMACVRSHIGLDLAPEISGLVKTPCWSKEYWCTRGKDNGNLPDKEGHNNLWLLRLLPHRLTYAEIDLSFAHHFLLFSEAVEIGSFCSR